MRFRILGHLEVQGPDGWTAISAAKWRSLLACLLVRPGQLVPTESLIFELWGENPPSTANNMVSIYVHRLRKEVIGDAGGRVLVRQAPGYLLRVAPGDVDIQVFEALVGQGRSELAAGRADRAAELLGEALGLWRGPLLADVPPSPALVTPSSGRPSSGSTRPSCASRPTWPATGRPRWWRSCAAWWRTIPCGSGSGRCWCGPSTRPGAGPRRSRRTPWPAGRSPMSSAWSPGASCSGCTRELLAADASSASASASPASAPAGSGARPAFRLVPTRRAPPARQDEGGRRQREGAG